LLLLKENSCFLCGFLRGFGASVKPVLSRGRKGVHHVIAHLTCSGREAVAGNGVPSSIPDREGASRNASEPVVASLRKAGMARLSETMKPSADDGAMVQVQSSGSPGL